jgi:hypothetical protein
MFLLSSPGGFAPILGRFLEEGFLRTGSLRFPWDYRDAVTRFKRIVNRPIHGAGSQGTFQLPLNSLACDLNIPWYDFGADASATVTNSSDNRRARSKERIQDPISFTGHGENQPLDKFNRELTRMLGFFHMVALNVRNHPKITWVLSQGIARVLPCLRPFEILLSRVFLGHTHRVKIKRVVVGFGEPDYCLVSAGKPPAAMQTVLKVPDNSIPHPKTKVFENGV